MSRARSARASPQAFRKQDEAGFLSGSATRTHSRAKSLRSFVTPAQSREAFPAGRAQSGLGPQAILGSNLLLRPEDCFRPSRKEVAFAMTMGGDRCPGSHAVIASGPHAAIVSGPSFRRRASAQSGLGPQAILGSNLLLRPEDCFRPSRKEVAFAMTMDGGRGRWRPGRRTKPDSLRRSPRGGLGGRGRSPPPQLSKRHEHQAESDRKVEERHAKQGCGGLAVPVESEANGETNEDQ